MTWHRPPAEREFEGGRLVVPPGALDLVLDVLHKRDLATPGGPYAWYESEPHAVHGSGLRHDLDVPLDLGWLREHAVLPDDVVCLDYDEPGGPVVHASGGWVRIEVPLHPDRGGWPGVWRQGEPWDGTRPVVRTWSDRLLGRPGRRQAPSSSDPDWRSATGGG